MFILYIYRESLVQYLMRNVYPIYIERESSTISNEKCLSYRAHNTAVMHSESGI